MASLNQHDVIPPTEPDVKVEGDVAEDGFDVVAPEDAAVRNLTQVRVVGGIG